jgi:hypothetical protein
MLYSKKLLRVKTTGSFKNLAQEVLRISFKGLVQRLNGYAGIFMYVSLTFLQWPSTVCFTDLGKLNLLMVVQSYAKAIFFLFLPQPPLKTKLTIKVVKIE